MADFNFADLIKSGGEAGKFLSQGLEPQRQRALEATTSGIQNRGLLRSTESTRALAPIQSAFDSELGSRLQNLFFKNEDLELAKKRLALEEEFGRERLSLMGDANENTKRAANERSGLIGNIFGGQAASKVLSKIPGLDFLNFFN